MNDLTNAQILIVEDSNLQAAVLRKMFQDQGYQVRLASNGQEALNAARQQRPDAIVSDIVMPVMDGYTMCHAIKSDPALQDVPVILLTSLADTEDIIQGLRAKADYYLTKPHEKQEEHQFLLTTVQAALVQPRNGKTYETAEPLDVAFNGKTFAITAGRRAMLDLLLATYSNAVQQNRELIETHRELRSLNEQLQRQQQRIEQQQLELQKANLALLELASRDGLTGLKNHAAFQEKLAEEFARASRYQLSLSVILLDVDRFKAYNDTFGHPAGDEVLKNVAKLLRATVREGDFVARYGGEEFVVVLPSTGYEASKISAERLRAAIANAPWTDRAMTASFGVATLAPELVQPSALVSEADVALYTSKSNGRNRITHAQDLT